MPEFKREERYIVVKIKDLDQQDRQAIDRLFYANQIQPVECVVVEADWPIYEETGENVQRLAEGRPSIREGKIEALEHAADLGAALDNVIGDKWELIRKLDVLEGECREAQANDRQAMTYLEEIRQIVGKDLDFPGVIKALADLKYPAEGDLDQLALDTARAIANIDSADLPGGYPQALARSQNLIRDALQQVRSSQ